jgi:hypothetical protein
MKNFDARKIILHEKIFPGYFNNVAFENKN